jgi:hypothetical protein
LKRAQRSDVGLREVDHMDVVAHAGAVACGVVVAEDQHFVAKSRGRLRDKGNQVVRHAAR